MIADKLMEIKYLGHASFRLKGKDSKVVMDPFDSDMVGIKFPSVDADIVTISHSHKDHSRADLVKDVKMVIDSPGEYEVMQTSFIGLSSYHDDKKGEQRGENTIFVVEIDELRIAHLGDLGHGLSEKQVEAIGDVDVLMVPVGGVYTINSKVAIEVVHSIEPIITIPMHYRTDKHNKDTFEKLETVEEFLANVGLSVEKDSKLVVRKDTLADLQKVVLLEDN